ncbi:MAG: BspA family leucine-rich repeat surface protein [Spirochaetia bacterium]|nr:BspA family leucine-rich repeat surface protein [Spirochaetia bacterium]
MKDFRQTIKMMAMALAMGIALCSCSVAGGSDSYGAAPAKAEASNSTTTTAQAVPAKAANSEIRPQAVLRGTQLTFYYDNKDHDTEGTVYEVSSIGYGVKGAPWAASGFVSASFDESCQNWNPTSMVFFFSGCTKAVSIDCTNLNTASVIDMSCMFQKCRSLDSLDLTGFDTSKVIEMYRMFNECGVLQSITVDSSFIQKASQTGSYEMYRLCPAQLING